MEEFTMLKKAKRVISILIAGALALGLIVLLPALAETGPTGGMETAPLSAEAPFTTYTIVDPGNGENGTTIRTWAQIPVLWTIDIGDTVKIEATTSPTVRTTIDFSNGYTRMKDDPPVGLVNTIIGVAGITYENVAISVFGDTTVQDLSIEYAYGSSLTFKGVLWNQTSFIQAWADNYYYHNYPATLTVNGDCSFVASSITGGGHGVYVMLYSVLELIIEGSGTLTTKGVQSGISFLYDDYMADKDRAQKAVLTINIPVSAELTYYTGLGGLTLGSGSGSAMYRRYEVNGNGSLTTTVADTANTGPTWGYYGYGNGIYSRSHELTFSGDLRIYSKGFGIHHGLDLEASVELIFDLTYDAIFEGGDYGSGFRLLGIANGFDTLNALNKGTGNVIFRGGIGNGYGIWFHNGGPGRTLKLSNTKKGRFMVNGGGYGSGLRLEYNDTLDISGLNYDLELVGAENTPTRVTEPDPWAYFTDGIIHWLRRSSAGLLIDQEGCGIILGDNNLLCQGGPNGGAGIDFIRASDFTVESTGGQLYALGGKGAYGNGFITGTGAMTFKGNGTINAYGGYNSAGVFGNNNGSLILGSGITLNATGGANAPALHNIYSLTFTDNTPIARLTNSGKENHIQRVAAQSSGTWNIIDAAFTIGNESSLNATISIAPGKTGVIRR